MRSIYVAVGLIAIAAAPALAQSAKGPAWRWSSQPDLYPEIELRAKVLHTVYALREVPINKHDSHAELRRELSKGAVSQVVWRTPIKTRAWTKLTGAAMVVSGDAIYIARYNRIATGCTLSAYSKKTGAELWSTPLVGIGPIGHSKWFNRVQLGIEAGNPVAFGNEGPGRGYIEVRDAKTGKLVSNTTRAISGGRPRVLAEALFVELTRGLAKKRRLTVGLDDFAKRHVFRFASTADRDREFATAARQLDGLGIEGGGTLRVSIATGADGRPAIRATR